MKEIIGRKLGMTRVFATDGTQYAVTVIEVLPNVIIQTKTVEKDGYQAFVVGYGNKNKNSNKCEKGLAEKNKLSVPVFIREVNCDNLDNLNLTVGSKLDASLFQAGDIVDVIGTSKGKGYTGVIKRYHHIIGPKSHGSGYHRGQGSFANNGRCSNRVVPGKKMSGHFGFHQVTTLNLLVLEVNSEKGYILLNGAVPGSKKSLVKIRSAIKVHDNKKIQVKLLINNNVIKNQSTTK